MVQLYSREQREPAERVSSFSDDLVEAATFLYGLSQTVERRLFSPDGRSLDDVCSQQVQQVREQSGGSTSSTAGSLKSKTLVTKRDKSGSAVSGSRRRKEERRLKRESRKQKPASVSDFLSFETCTGACADVDLRPAVVNTTLALQAYAHYKTLGGGALGGAVATSCIPIVVPFTAPSENVIDLWPLTERSIKIQKSLLCLTVSQGSMALFQLLLGDLLGGFLGGVMSVVGTYAATPQGTRWLPTYTVVTFINGSVGALSLLEKVTFSRFPLFALSNPFVVNIVHGILLASPIMSFAGVFYAYQYMKELRSQVSTGYPYNNINNALNNNTALPVGGTSVGADLRGNTVGHPLPPGGIPNPSANGNPNDQSFMSSSSAAGTDADTDGVRPADASYMEQLMPSDNMGMGIPSMAAGMGIPSMASANGSVPTTAASGPRYVPFQGNAHRL